METVFCTICNEENASLVCKDCKSLICKNCSSVCRECGITICINHTKQTKAGTKMCAGCMAEREARRQALRDKYAKPSKPSKSTPSTSFESLDDSPSIPSSSPEGKSQSTRLEDLAGAEQLLRPLGESEEEAELDKHYEEDNRIPTQEENKAYFTETGRLELPPMDQNRPVLGASGYEPPSRATTLIVLIFFGLAMVFAVRAVPALNDTLFPFTHHQTNFNEKQMLIVTETNALRDGGNIQGLDIFAQGATFFMAWGFLIAYGGGVLMLLTGVIRSILWSREAKTQHEVMKNLDQESKDLYM